jgi:hypothetical protein
MGLSQIGWIFHLIHPSEFATSGDAGGTGEVVDPSALVTAMPEGPQEAPSLEITPRSGRTASTLELPRATLQQPGATAR